MRAIRKHKFLFGYLLLLAAAVAGSLALRAFLTQKCEEVCLPRLTEALCAAPSDKLYAVETDGVPAYRPARELAELLQPENWTEAKAEDGGILMTVRLADEYELRLLEPGVIKAYYGYASWPERDSAFYRLPDETAAAVRDYAEAFSP